jgi:hypothetical protein
MGQVSYLNVPIVSTQQAYPHARPRAERPDFRGLIPPSEDQIQKAAAFDSHQVARGGAARAASRRIISNEEVNSKAAADARSAATGTAATQAQVQALQAALDDQQAVNRALALTNRQILLRLDAIDGNPDGNSGEAQ